MTVFAAATFVETFLFSFTCCIYVEYKCSVCCCTILAVGLVHRNTSGFWKVGQFVPQPLPQGGVDGGLPLSQTHGPECSANAGWCTPDLSSQAGVHADIDHGNEVVGGQSSLGTDMWRQLKRVSLPIFSGGKRQFESWHAAFKACIDQAPATAEYKLLQLRQYLSGEALQAIDNLGHSAAAYEGAKRRLERKYGGARRRLVLQLEELEAFSGVRKGNVKDVEKFADLLDVAVLNLQEAEQREELGCGTLYRCLLKKLPEDMVAQYQRWMSNTGMQPAVETLRDWILQEAEYRIVAAEAVRGVQSQLAPAPTSGGKASTNRPGRTYFAQSDSGLSRSCKVCSGKHGAWACPKFKSASVEQRWNWAKEFELCFRCLGSDHVGKACPHSRSCGLGRCPAKYSRLLHRSVTKSQAPESKTGQSTPAANGKPVITQHCQTKADVTLTPPSLSAMLRTVPIILEHKGRRVQVNALLDDGSNQSYVNVSVAHHLGLHGKPEVRKVNVLNGQETTFTTTPVECELHSVDGTLSTIVSLLTTEKVTGNLKPVDWYQEASKWGQLTDIPFPRLEKKSIVDVLLGVDHADLHYSVQDVRGKPGQPIARHTPLGWMCVAPPSAGALTRTAVGFCTYFGDVTFSLPDPLLSTALKAFWELEEVPSAADLNLSAEDKEVVQSVQASMKL